MAKNIEMLKKLSNVGWINPGDQTGVLYSDTMTLEAADLLKSKFNKDLPVEIRSSQSEPGKVRLFVSANKVNSLIAMGATLINTAPIPNPKEVEKRKIILMVQLQLSKQSGLNWVEDLNTPNKIFSDRYDKETAYKVLQQCSPYVKPELRESSSQPGTYRVMIDVQAANELLKQNKALAQLPVPVVLKPLIPPAVIPQKQPRLNIAEAEWQAAEAFFKNPENQLKGKFRKKDPARGVYNAAFDRGSTLKAAAKHSFLYINGKIYAVANGEYRVGSGTYGNVKVIQDRKGNSDVVKIENYNVKEQSIENKGGIDQESEIGERLGMVKGGMVRKLEKLLIFKKQLTEHKLYTVLEDRGKEELFDVLNNNLVRVSPDLSVFKNPAQGLQIAIACCEQIQALHDLRILHCDIKPENFMASQEGDHYLISAIDFGFSKYLPAGASYISWHSAEGTPGYAAPEIINQRKYSYASDVYALGQFFHFLGVQSDITQGMIAENPYSRTTLPSVQAQLIEQLRKTSNLNAKALQLIYAHDKEINETKILIAKQTNTLPSDWHYHAERNAFYSPVYELDTAFNLQKEIPWGTGSSEIVLVDPPDGYQVEIHYNALRAHLVDERKTTLFKDLETHLTQHLNDPSITVEFIDKDDNNAKGKHVTVTGSVGSMGRLQAMQAALIDMNIPCKLVQNLGSNNNTFSLILQDNILAKIENMKDVAAKITQQPMIADKAKEFSSQFSAMQKATRQLRAIIKDVDDMHSFAFSKGKNKGMHISLDFQAAVERSKTFNLLTSVGLNPKLEGTNPLKIIVGTPDLQKIANDPFILARLQPLPPPPTEPLPPSPKKWDLPPPPVLNVSDAEKEKLIIAAIQSATSVQGLINNIANYPYDIIGINKKPADKNVLLVKMRELSTTPHKVKAMLESYVSPYLFNGTYISNKHGMRDKFIELVRKENQNNSASVKMGAHRNPAKNTTSIPKPVTDQNRAQPVNWQRPLNDVQNNHLKNQCMLLTQALEQIDKMVNADIYQKARLTNFTIDAILNEIENRKEQIEPAFKKMCQEKQVELWSKFDKNLVAPPTKEERELVKKLQNGVNIGEPPKKNRNT